jgi:hypothetical protein
MPIVLPYRISLSSDNTHYLLSIDEDYLNTLEISETIKDQISSLGITIDPHFTFFGRRNDQRLIGEYFCYRLKQMLEECWDFSFGVPVIKFSGYTNKLDDLFKNRPLMIYFTRNDAADIAIWDKEISLVSKFRFIADLTDFGFGIFTTDTVLIRTWLRRQKFKLISAPANYKQSAEYRMQLWFPDPEIRKKLMFQAKKIIDRFVIVKQFNIYIPEYAVIDSLHVKRFKTIDEIFRKKYDDLNIVMTLPMLLDNKEYTILFPVCGSLNRNNVKGY